MLSFGLIIMIAVSWADVPLSLLGRQDLVCPVCRCTFTTVVCVQSNTRGGVDRDLFARAVGPQPEYYRISTCPKCGYSGYDLDFDPHVILPPDFRHRILNQPGLPLPQGFTPKSDPRELDASERYKLAIICYKWGQKSDEALAWLHLRASWIARDFGSILPPDQRLAKVLVYQQHWQPMMRPQDNQVDVELKTATRMAEALASGQFNRYQKPYVELALALILRCRGENRQAGPMLDRLVKYERFSTSLREGIERMRESIDKEKKYQIQAADYFERAWLTKQINEANLGPACYLLGELYRRLGRDSQAVPWYDKALNNQNLPEELKIWAKQQRTWSIAGNRP